MTPPSLPFDTTEAYVAYFSQQSLPVLRRTLRELEALRREEDSVSGRRIAAIILSDPLMAMRVITLLEHRRGAHQNHDITTIDRAVMMMGISPFFHAVEGLPTVEDLLAGRPKALIGLLKVIARARRSATYARDWAIVRHDLDVEEITLAALLHEATEMLCWCFAPELSERLHELQRNNPKQRSSDAQRAIFGFPTQDIQWELIKIWQLPQLLVSLMNEADADNPRVRTVTLAAALARHSARGWNDPALTGDLEAIGALLHSKRSQLLRRLGVPPEEAQRFMIDD